MTTGTRTTDTRTTDNRTTGSGTRATVASDPGRDDGTGPLAAAKAPVGVAPVAVTAVVVAVAVTALGVVAVRDALVAAGALSGSPWITGTVTGLDGTGPAPWVAVVGVVLLAVGLWLVLTALRPRRRTGMALRASTGVFLRPRDVGRLASHAAADVDGVLDAKASTTLRRVQVQVTTTGDPGTEQQVRDAVTGRLSHLDPAPSVRVRARTEGRATGTENAR